MGCQYDIPMNGELEKTSVSIAIATPLKKPRVVKKAAPVKRAAKPAVAKKVETAKAAPSPTELTPDLYKLLMNTNSKTSPWSFDGQLRFAKCVKVYDGDTAHFTFVPSPGLPPARYVVRMNGYNSAELRGSDANEKAAAEAARDYLSTLIKGKVVLLSLGKPDKYGRLLADVFTIDGAPKVGGNETVKPVTSTSNHVNLNMLTSGHGKAYTGRGKKAW